ncbi:MAG: dTDP-4-dehydrorhamnose 3,5-epimerase [Flavobacteriales bacterium]|nr:dTDP-4-dehydrorhamnose 3,5-epimerase [Flavobacteriales bacterium]
MIREWHDIEGLELINPRIFADDRGIFFESHNERMLQNNPTFVQDNQSVSKKGVIRGIHFQVDPYAQGKLVRVVNGSINDIAVDLRENSKTYGDYAKVRLDTENNAMFWIPSGFGHGFEALEDNTVVLYKCTSPYSSSHERAIIWNDNTLDIEWDIKHPIVSSKDQQASYFKDYVPVF